MATVTWVATAPGVWSNTANWSSSNVPQAGDDVVFDGLISSQPCTVDVTTNLLQSLSTRATYSGAIKLQNTIQINSGTTKFTHNGGIIDLTSGVIKMYAFAGSTLTTSGGSVITNVASNSVGYFWLLNGVTLDLSTFSVPNLVLAADGTGISTMVLSADLNVPGFIQIDGFTGVTNFVLAPKGTITCGSLTIQAQGAGTGKLDLSVTPGSRLTVNGNTTISSNGTLVGGTGIIDLNGNFTINAGGVFNSGTSTVQLLGNLDESAGTANWQTSGNQGTLEFVSGANATIKTAGYANGTQNFFKLQIDGGALVSAISDFVVQGTVGPNNLIVNGVLDLGGHSLIDYGSGGIYSGASGNGTIRNGLYSGRWQGIGQNFGFDSKLKLNMNFTLLGINPISASGVTGFLVTDMNINGTVTISANGFSAGLWTGGIATFSFNGHNLTCNALTMNDQGGSTNSLYCVFDFTNSVVDVNGKLQIGSTGTGTFSVLKTNNSTVYLSGNLESNTTGQAWPVGNGSFVFVLSAAQSIVLGTAGSFINLPVVYLSGPSTLSATGSFNTLNLICNSPNGSPLLVITNGATWTLAQGGYIIGQTDLPLVIRSSTPGSQWNLIGTSSVGVATSKLVNVDIKDCNATSGIVLYAFTSIDSGNNLNISFRKSGLGQMGTAFNLVDLIGNALVTNSETLSASSAKSANASYTADLSVYRSGSFICDVTAWVGGASPTIQFVVEALDSNSGKWVPIATPTAGAASAVETLVIIMDETTSTLPTVAGFRYVQAHPLMGIGPGQNYRVRTVITGAPTSVTFSVSFLGRPV